MKKILLLSIVSLLTLCGCHGEKPDTPEPTPDVPTPVESEDDFERTFKYDSKLIKGRELEMPLHYLNSDFKEDNTIK